MAVVLRIRAGVAHLESNDGATFAEWREVVDSIPRHPQYRPGMGVIHDWRSHTIALKTAEIEARTRHLAEHAAALAPLRWALLVARDVDYGMGRMAEAFLQASAPGIRFGVFRDPAEAEAWVRADGFVPRPHDHRHRTTLSEASE